jgi:tripartite-type tricarboxylate transporter receptor subunit TctC
MPPGLFCSRLLRSCLLTLAASLPALVHSGSASAEAWPSKPLRWVVAYPAGGGSDFLARTVAPQLGKQLGQSIVIDNRPGAAGIIGSENAAKSPADGYTLMSGDNGVLIFNEAMYRKLPYSPGDFTPVGFMARFPLILAVNPASGFTSARQLLDELKKQPGKYSYASPGVGSPHHLAMELLKQRAAIDALHVPYRGTAMAVQDVIAGQVPIAVLDTAAGLAQIRGGKLRALAVMSKKRIPSLPDVPTLDEIGVKDFEATAWQSLFVPRGTPPDIVARLTAEMNKAISKPEIRLRLEEFGLEVLPGDGPALAQFLQKETLFWHALIKARGLVAE